MQLSLSNDDEVKFMGRKKLLTHKHISKDVRNAFGKSLVRSTLIYGSENRRLGRQEEIRLLSTEIRVRRKMTKGWTERETSSEVFNGSEGKKEGTTRSGI